MNIYMAQVLINCFSDYSFHEVIVPVTLYYIECIENTFLFLISCQAA